MIAQEQLSNDTNELKAIVCQLIGVVEEQKILIANQNQRIEALCQTNEEQSQKIDQLTYEVNVLKRHRFGKRSEKLNEDNETTPDNSNEAIEPPNSPDAHNITITVCQISMVVMGDCMVFKLMHSILTLLSSKE